MMESAQFDIQAEKEQILCSGDWTPSGIEALSRRKVPINLPADLRKVTCRGENVQNMDSAGAYFLRKLLCYFRERGIQVEYDGFSHAHQEAIALVESNVEDCSVPKLTVSNEGFLYQVGEAVIDKSKTACDLLHFLGKMFYALCILLRKLRFPAWRSILITIERSGYHSLPIIALLLFLIGIVLSYQMGVQLKRYGANVYIVGLTGTAMLREFGPLITAIIVAGKTASSFTAEIGIMKINEEVDALHTLGISPIERLVLPKIIGLLISLPLLTIWANGFGVFGSMVMAKSLLHLPYTDYIARFKHDVLLRNYIIGLSKTPIFAVIISGVGCFQGMQVRGSAESLGYKTTISVVQSIFLIIVVDAWFSVMFSWTGM